MYSVIGLMSLSHRIYSVFGMMSLSPDSNDNDRVLSDIVVSCLCTSPAAVECAYELALAEIGRINYCGGGWGVIVVCGIGS